MLVLRQMKITGTGSYFTLLLFWPPNICSGACVQVPSETKAPQWIAKSIWMNLYACMVMHSESVSMHRGLTSVH